MSNDLFIIALSLILSAFFSGMETAFASSNKLKIYLEKGEGKYTNSIVSKFTERPSNFIISMLIGNIISIVVFSTYFSLIIKPFIILSLSSNPYLVLLFQVLITSFFVLIIADFLPKVIFFIFPNQLLSFFAFPAILAVKLFYPFSIVINYIANLFLNKFLGVNSSSTDFSFSRVDLDDYLEEHNEILKNSNTNIEPEIEILKNALNFSKTRVRDCMIPRTDIVGVEINDTVEDLKKKFISTGHSKILVYKKNLDNIIAYVHSYEIFKKPENINEILLPISIVSESMLVKEALDSLLKKRRSVSLVVDEYGGTSGLICVEDIIEELVGEIEDEHDETTFNGIKLSDKKFHLSGKHKIHELNKMYLINFDKSDEYDTLNGYIIGQIGRIPKNQEEIIIANHKFKILNIKDNFIEEVILCVMEE
ncbi:MAG: hemolysin family protein [Bacteroidota bacterium]|nr:hemolysin family protein [Bacteroidota bacterium]